MRTLIFSLLLVAVTVVGHAQEQKITQLEEAKVGFAPLDAKITQIGDSFSYKVEEAYAGEFTKDAIGFMKANFDINNFITEFEGDKYTSYLVTFRSKKGHLSANFNQEGELVKTYQKFKDIVLPLDVRREVYMTNKGWTMTSNKYIASGRGDLVEKEVYKIKLDNGNQKRSIKLNPRSVSRNSVAVNN
ncbi:hypothetical protein [Christiangramia forsetii]|uniref:Secreted protein n=2 Tax=Christiangramia forsetii TaxID=411153 RepID=A0LZC1_CHRFK|nr:hypothetical protein [Christiangramia forsetii]GGG37963.1 hypothetical protein GCM10011532_22060 [Christiangramia forsetii]CAL65716.1 secreted protein [Christiangramia forsetii KT0803]